MTERHGERTARRENRENRAKNDSAAHMTGTFNGTSRTQRFVREPSSTAGFRGGVRVVVAVTDDANHQNASRAAAALLKAVDPPLYVVTATDEQGHPSGCLAGFVTQCSLLPVRYLICVSKLNHTFFVAEHASSLALHLLGRSQEELAVHFGALSGDTTDKFAGLSWRTGLGGAPVLQSCAAWVEGPIIRRYGVGDHEAVVIAPVDGGSGTETGRLSTNDLPDFHAGHPPA
jgi:flavin reductase (DIM6/NTAB) family NADH-FMN oxidoreductase RutF